MSHVKPQDVEALIQLFDSSHWDEMRVTWKDLDLYLSKDPAQNPTPPTGTNAALTAPLSARGRPEHALRSGAPTQPGDLPVREKWHIPEGLLAIHAPNLGTFYRAPKPGTAPFVEVGQSVDVNTEVCIIEVMKLFTAVRAGVRGIVREVLVNDAEMVEFSQPLFLIESTP